MTSLHQQMIADTRAIFPSLVTGTVQILISGVPVFSVDVIDNSTQALQQVMGVGLVRSEPHIVLLVDDAARITALISTTAQPTVRIGSVDWQVYGEPINHRTGLTTLNLIRT